MSEKTETKRITVEEYISRTTDKGRSYVILRSEGEGYFVWDASLLVGVKEGSDITITYEPGKYPKVTDVQLASGPAPAGRQSSVQSFPAEIETVERQRGIHRSVALQEANKLVQANFGIDKPVTIADLSAEIIKVASQFENFLSRRDEPIGDEAR